MDTSNGFREDVEELDSELDSFLAEIDDIEQSKPEEIPEEPNLIIWKECVDETTKHPYYWHTETQEVTWVKPESFDKDLVAHENAIRQWKTRCEEIKKINEERKQAAELRKKIASEQPKPTVVRKNPRIELEGETNGKKAVQDPGGSFGKMGKFNFMKSEAEQKLPPTTKSSARLTFTVKKAPPAPEEAPPAPQKSAETPGKRPKISVPTHTASGKPRTVTEIAAEIKKKKQQIALTNARIHLQKRVEEQKLNKKVLDIPKEPKQIKEVKSRPKEDKNAKEEKKHSARDEKRIRDESKKASSPQLESKKRRIFQEVKTTPVLKEVDRDMKRAIEKEAALLKEKLEFLGGDLSKISKFQVHIIALETRISDFVDGHLSVSYVQGKITELAQMLRSHEENSVTKDWTCTFDRDEKRYRYTNKTSGKSQFTHPGEDEASSSSESEKEDDEEEEEEEDKNDDLYELFQQEIKVIEEKTKEPEEDVKAKSPEKSVPPREVTPPPPTPPVPPPLAPPPIPPPEERSNYQPGYVDPWTPYTMMMGQMYQGMMGAAPPPPPPDDGMMETYSPGNSDSEEDETKKAEREEREKNKGVVRMKAPLRYTTPPASADGATKTEVEAEVPSPHPPASEKKEEKKEEKVKKIVKKKKKVDGLVGTNKKNKNMSNLVAKWNKVNKHADVAMK